MSYFTKNNVSIVSPTGSVMAYLGTTDPEGWVICDGNLRTWDDKYENLVNMGIGIGSSIIGNYVPPNYQSAIFRAIGSQTIANIFYDTSGNVKDIKKHTLEEHAHTYIDSYFNENTNTWAGGGVASGAFVGYDVSNNKTTVKSGNNIQSCPMHVCCNWIVKI